MKNHSGLSINRMSRYENENEFEVILYDAEVTFRFDHATRKFSVSADNYDGFGKFTAESVSGLECPDSVTSLPQWFADIQRYIAKFSHKQIHLEFINAANEEANDTLVLTIPETSFMPEIRAVLTRPRPDKMLILERRLADARERIEALETWNEYVSWGWFAVGVGAGIMWFL